MFMDVVYEAGGGFYNGKNPMREYSLRIPTLIFCYYGVVRSGIYCREDPHGSNSASHGNISRNGGK